MLTIPASTPTTTGPVTAFPNEALTMSELAALLKVSLQTAKRLSGQQAIPGTFRIGRLVRFHRQRVLEWLDRGCPMPS